jgi:hypothetical protein
MTPEELRHALTHAEEALERTRTALGQVCKARLLALRVLNQAQSRAKANCPGLYLGQETLAALECVKEAKEILEGSNS